MSISKKTAISLSAVSLVLGVGIGFGVSSCSPQQNDSPSISESASPNVSVPSEAPSSGEMGDKTQAGAKATVDSFFKQISDDVVKYQDSLTSNLEDSETDRVFRESFAGSTEYLKDGAFSDEEGQAFISSFAQYYIFGKTTIEAEASAYVISGSEATIRSTDFTLTVDGKVQEQQPTANGDPAKMKLVFENDKWLISGFESGQ